MTRTSSVDSLVNIDSQSVASRSAAISPVLPPSDERVRRFEAAVRGTAARPDILVDAGSSSATYPAKPDESAEKLALMNALGHFTAPPSGAREESDIDHYSDPAAASMVALSVAVDLAGLPTPAAPAFLVGSAARSTAQSTSRGASPVTFLPMPAAAGSASLRYPHQVQLETSPADGHGPSAATAATASRQLDEATERERPVQRSAMPEIANANRSSGIRSEGALAPFGSDHTGLAERWALVERSGVRTPKADPVSVPLAVQMESAMPRAATLGISHSHNNAGTSNAVSHDGVPASMVPLAAEMGPVVIPAKSWLAPAQIALQGAVRGAKSDGGDAAPSQSFSGRDAAPLQLSGESAAPLPQSSDERVIAFSQLASRQVDALPQSFAVRDAASLQLSGPSAVPFAQPSGERVVAFSRLSSGEAEMPPQLSGRKDGAFSQLSGGKDDAHLQLSGVSAVAFSQSSAGRDVTYQQWSSGKDNALQQLSGASAPAFPQLLGGKNSALSQLPGERAAALPQASSLGREAALSTAVGNAFLPPTPATPTVELRSPSESPLAISVNQPNRDSPGSLSPVALPQAKLKPMTNRGEQSKPILSEATSIAESPQPAVRQAIQDVDRSGPASPDGSSLKEVAAQSEPDNLSDVSENHRARQVMAEGKPEPIRQSGMPSASRMPSTSIGYEVKSEAVKSISEEGVGIVSPVLVTQVSAPVVIAAAPSVDVARITEQITRLLVHEVRDGQRVVTVEVQGLQGVQVSVRDVQGEWLVSFACSTDGPRHMLNDRATSMAAELAARLAYPVRVRVTTDDPLEPAVREVAADSGKRHGAGGRDERRADAGSSARR